MSELAKIFVLTGDDSLTAMEEHRYDSEDLLQQFLARYPELLAGDQIDPDEPRRWLFIGSEIGVPEEPGGPGRWSLDHLFVDQDGVPTLVECKRSSDTRIRREVVGQLLDYAANASEYWPIDRLRQSAAETAAKAGDDLDAKILTFLEQGDPETLEEFWDTVERNLRAGRIRLLFVSDGIPRELRRIVEFLNTQMERTEVLAVEVKQFTGEGSTVFAPRVLGVSEAARETKQAGRPASPRRHTAWTMDEFENYVREAQWDPQLKELMGTLVALARQLNNERQVEMVGGTGQTPSISLKRANRNLVGLRGFPAVTIYYDFWHLPAEITRRLQSELHDILGDSDKVYETAPNIAPLLHQHDPGLEQFQKWLRKVLAEFRRAEESSS